MKNKRYFSELERIEIFRIIQEKTGYPLANRYLLSQAFRRSSYCAAEGGKSNEMLEFIGDQVLSYYLVKILAQRCGAENFDGDYSFRVRQNQFSTLKQELLSNESFAKIIDDWAIADYLIVGKDDEKNEVHKQTKIKADLFEAIIGAITVACKWDSAILEKVVNKALNLDAQIAAIIQSESHWFRFDMDNAVTKLKELGETEWCSQPNYKITDIGYDKDGNPLWSCTCTVVNEQRGITILVFASSKKNAKKAAAYLVLCELFQVQNKYGVNQNRFPWVYKDGKLMPDMPEMR